MDKQNTFTDDSDDWRKAEDSLHFARTGLQHKVLKRLKRGQITIEDTLDLHRKTTEEAREITRRFIDHCVQMGKRCVCIIHGKGRFSDKPILKNFMNQWLRQHPMVLAFYSAQPRHGGTGALYVLLKRGFHEE